MCSQASILQLTLDACWHLVGVNFRCHVMDGAKQWTAKTALNMPGRPLQGSCLHTVVYAIYCGTAESTSTTPQPPSTAAIWNSLRVPELGVITLVLIRKIVYLQATTCSRRTDIHSQAWCLLPWDFTSQQAQICSLSQHAC